MTGVGVVSARCRGMCESTVPRVGGTGWEVTGMELRVLAAIRAHAREDAPREACGLVLRTEDGKAAIARCRNIAREPTERFLMDPTDYLLAKDRGALTALYHSHVTGSAQPSEADRVCCNAVGLPYVIYSVERNEWSSCTPDGYEAPLVGREWYEGVQDCFSLVRDYFGRMRLCSVCGEAVVAELVAHEQCDGPWSDAGPIVIPDVFRVDDWWDERDEQGQPKYDYWRTHHAAVGFVEVPFETARLHDVLVMCWPGIPVPVHGAVYMGDRWILHQPRYRVSRRERMSNDQRDSVALALRHRMFLRPGDTWRA